MAIPTRPAPSAPLDALTITWQQHRSPFSRECLAYTITGQQLARVLSWLGREIPTGNWGVFRDPESIGYEVLALAETCRALSEAEFNAIVIDPGVVFRGLADQLSSIGNRLSGDMLGGATVSIAARQLDGLGEKGGA